MNILFIAFEFPPINKGGVHRPMAFVKYLPEFDVDPIVITLHTESYGQVYESGKYDENFGLEVRNQAKIIQVRANKALLDTGFKKFASIYFSIHGNETKHWKNNFYEAVKLAIDEHLPKLIFATVPPFSILPLVNDVAEKYNLPLILDFRDAWSQWRTNPYGSVFHYWKTLSFERKYLHNAAAIIGTSKQTISDFKRLHPEIPQNKFYYIPNGYTGELKEWKPLDSNKTTFIIGYVGSFYYSPDARIQMLQPWWKKRGHRILQYVPHKQDWLYRSPFFFFKALQQLNEIYPELGKKIKVRFAGKIQSWLEEMITSFQLQHQVELMGEVSHKDSLLFQENCDALLITSAKQIGSRDYSIAGKTFEYLQMQRPIMAFVCEGAQKEILKEGGTALMCDPDNTKDSVEQMNKFFKGETVQSPDRSFLETLSRKRLTEQLAKIIRSQVMSK